MKKLLALSLALVMALGMTSVALASTTYYIGGNLTGVITDGVLAGVSATTDGVGFRATDGVVVSTKKVGPSDNITPGWTVFYVITDETGKLLTDSDQVKGATIKQTWDMGKDYIDSISIVKKKFISDYYYFVAIAYKTSTSTGIYDIAGDVTLTKSTTTTSSGATTGEPFSATLTIAASFSFANANSLNIASETTALYNFASSGGIATQNAKDAASAAQTTYTGAQQEAAYTYCKGATATAAYDLAGTYTDLAALVADAGATPPTTAFSTADLLKVNTYALVLAKATAANAVTTGTEAIEGDQTITTDTGYYFDVDLTGQGKLLLYYDEKYNSTVAATYPSANLDFVSFNGVSFNKTGELTILADPDTFLYALNADGSLSTIKSTYDEYEEAFKITTRTLGKYVISDIELKLVAASSVASSTDSATSSTTTPVKTNPGTGAAA